MTHFWRTLLTAVGLSLALALPAQAQWTTYRNDSGTTVPFPANLFTVRGGEGVPRGQVFTSADGRARLHIFAFENERNETPAQFIRRVIVDELRRMNCAGISLRSFSKAKMSATKPRRSS